jgi:predicted porin
MRLQVAVGAEYNLPQRTTVYAQAGYVDNDGTMNQTVIHGTPEAPGKSTTAAMVVIRHTL